MVSLYSVFVEKISYHPQSHSYAVILKDIEGELKLPVMVGSFEAQAIALALEKVSGARPMTHDLLKNVVHEFGYDIKSVVINDLLEGVFYANIVFADKTQTSELTIDSRPSDAIVLALKCSIPIFIYKHVMDEAGFIEAGETGVLHAKEKPIDPVEKLARELEAAVELENYEKAAEIRDRLKKINKPK